MCKFIYRLVLLTALFASTDAFCQFRVSGKVVDSKDMQPLPSAVASFTPVGGGAPQAQSSDLDGLFTIKVKEGKYTFSVKYLGYATYEKVIDLKGDLKLGTIRLKPEDRKLDEVKVTGVLARQEQRGDTTVFNADAFKVNPDATTEDLVKKMPGMIVEGNTVKSGGETIKKVLVDGKEFFGNDPMVALRNISADMVSKIEVYDKQSDQAAFTGFSDGNEERTINIMTKMGIAKGHFGRVYAGYGSDNRYEAGGNFNVFHGDHRISLIGMLNNVNQQNFAFDDVTGAMSMGGGRGMRGMFNAGQGGKNRTGSVGVNYTYDKEEKLKIEFSYFYNNNKNVSHSLSEQEYFVDTDLDSLRIYGSDSDSEGINNNHRTSVRVTWTIDDHNSIIFTPRLSWQGYSNEAMEVGSDTYNLRLFQRTEQSDESETKGLSANGDIMWRHKFNADKRTLTVRLGGSSSTSSADQTSLWQSEYAYTADRNMRTSQKTVIDSYTNGINGTVMYTEPLGDYMALQVNYSPSVSYSNGDRRVEADTIMVSAGSGVFDSYTFSPMLSNKKNSEYMRHAAGVGLNIFAGKDLNATLGVDFQEASLKGEQVYPIEFDTERSFTSVMPSFRLRYKHGRSVNLRMFYRTNTSAPSISQLQNVVDVSNVRVYSSGNDKLAQQYSHEARMFFAANSPETSRAIFLMGGLTATQDYITTSTVIASADSIIDNGILLPAGTQFNKPVNMDGFLSARANVTFSSPVKWLGSNVNITMGTNVQHKPSLYNGRKVQSDTYNLNCGLTVGSSFSENIDFTLSYNAGYNIVKSTAAAASNYNYYNHTAQCNVNLIALSRIVFNNNLSHQMTKGMGDNYDNNYVMWNAAIGYKFFADRRGELRFKVNDILDNNTSVSRSIRDAYVQTATTDVMRRYCMLTFTYKFKPLGKAPQSGDGPRMPPHGMMGPPPGR